MQQASTELDSQQAAAEAQAAVTEEKRKAYEQATAALDAYLKAQSQKYQDPIQLSPSLLRNVLSNSLAAILFPPAQ